MQNRKKVPLRKVLQLLSQEELKQLYLSLGKKESLEGLSRGFIIDKIQRSTKIEDLAKNEHVMLLLVSKVDELLSLLRGIIAKLEKSELIKMCHDIGLKKASGENITKSEMIGKMFDTAPIADLLRNKRLQERLRPKYISIADIRSLEKEFESLKTETDDISSRLSFISHGISKSENEIKEISHSLKAIEEFFDTGKSPDLQTFLKALYEEAVSTVGKPSPESFDDIVERLQNKLGIDEREFILKGIKLFLTYYMLSEVKDLPWQPGFEDFMKVLKEEFDKDRTKFGEKTTIPSLRDRVCRRMGISDEMFDNQLIKAWKENYIELEAGAPIGEFNIKYLVTKNGQKFYYASLK